MIKDLPILYLHKLITIYS